MKHFSLIISALFLFASCTTKTIDYEHVGTEYAQGFTLEQTHDFTRLGVRNPWHEGEMLAVYYLVHDDTTAVPDDGIRVRVPISRLATTSCTHIGFLKALDCLNAVCGVCDPALIYNAEVLTPSDGHEVFDIGDAMQVSVERVLRAAPEAVMVSTYAQGDAASARLRELGQVVIYNNEWTENHPLARTEWIRFVAAFFDQLPKADSLFQEISSEYVALTEQVKTYPKPKPSIMSGNNFRGTWYVSSGKMYMGVLFRDAGAKYAYADDESVMSIPLTIEKVLKQFSDADVWVGSAANTLDELRDMDDKHTWFKSYKNKRVYNFYRRRTPTGANDYWEMGVVHPEWVLSDLITILYPEQNPNRPLIFSNRLD